jgi:hypothetical protein
MPRWLIRLIAVVTLLTFLVGNGSAISHARAFLSHSPCSHPADPSSATCGCEHCLSEESPHSAPSPVEVRNVTPPSHGDDLPGSSCPCPGGCAFCSVAKVPGLSPLVTPAVVTLCLDDSLDAMPCVYASPFGGTLTRPPRF